MMDISEMRLGVLVCEAHAPRGHFFKVKRLLSLTATCEIHPGCYRQINVPSKRLD